MGKFKEGDIVGPTSNWTSVGVTIDMQGVVMKPKDDQRTNVTLVKWPHNEMEFHDEHLYLVRKGTEPQTVKAFVRGPKGSASFTDKPEAFHDLVDIGILFHVETVIHDGYVEYIYDYQKKPYCVTDKQTHNSLWIKFPKEV